MLTIQTTILLYKLRQLNKLELKIFSEKNDILTITPSDNIKLECINSYPYYVIIDDKKVINARLDEILFLVENNYISQTKKVIKITHHGYHCWQISLIKFCDFCFRSIAVPIVVALLTSIAYNHLLR